MKDMKFGINDIVSVEVDYDNLVIYADCYNDSIQDGATLEFKIITDGAKVWNDNYGVEGSPTWIDTNVPEVYTLTLVGDDHQVEGVVIDYLIGITVDEVETKVINDWLKESVCDC